MWRNQVTKRWQMLHGSADSIIKLLWVIHLAMTTLTWLQLGVWRQRPNNNFAIFKSAYLHLVNHQPLHTPYPNEYFDLFLYHPVFALFFAPITLLPAPFDLFIWLFGSTIAFLWTISHIGLEKKWIAWVLFLSIFDLSKNILHAQTNVLIASGMMATFIFFEKQKPTQAVISTVLNFCIKGFGAITGLMALFYPQSMRSIVQGLLATALFMCLPILVVSPSECVQYYADWLELLRGDTITEPFSLMGFLTFTCHVDKQNESYVLLSGGTLLMLYTLSMWLQKSVLTSKRRAYFLAFLLLWVVVFNRAAESPTYLMASTGLLLWFFFHKQAATASKPMTALFVVCFYVIAILPSDLGIPALKSLDKRYFFRPVFAFIPLLWLFFEEIKTHVQRRKAFVNQ
ncbi:MAG: DUF2029 domain-containing protein [Saprospiraceae bacterium]|nr:DUF2029 domain-containing protein [Saprospiraceae bacterium]